MDRLSWPTFSPRVEKLVNRPERRVDSPAGKYFSLYHRI